MSYQRRRQVRHGQEAGAPEQPSEPQQSRLSAAQTCRRLSQQGVQSVSGAELSESTVDCPTTETPQLVTEAEGNGQKAGVENTLKPSAELLQGGDGEDSDDSDVSDMYEEEELDEEEDDDNEEEDLSNGKTDRKADVVVTS